MLRCWLLLIAALLSLRIASADVLRVDNAADEMVLGQHMEYLADVEGTLGVAEALAAEGWQRTGHNNPNFGYTKTTYWLRLTLDNQSPQSVKRLLEVAYPVLDHLELWTLRNGAYDAHYRMGDKQPFSVRPYAHRNFVAPLSLPADSRTMVVIRVNSSSAVQIPAKLWTPDRFHQYDQGDVVLLGLYYGVIVGMLLYNLFLFFSLRENSGAYYVIWVGGMLMFMASLNGIAFQYLWPEATQWNDTAIVFFLSLAVLFASLFTFDFLDLQTSEARTSRIVVHFLTALGLIGVAGAFFLPYTIAIRMTIGIAIIAIIAALSIAGIRIRQGFAPARFYIAAWSFVMIGGAILALNKFGLIERNLFTENATQIGSAMEVLLLSFALADRLNIERRLREQAQREAFILQREANIVLEQRVNERTQELEEANRMLKAISVTDALTGISNRRHFDDQLINEIKRAQRSGEPLGLLLIDIDHFKSVNDTYGHQVGDDVLRHIAQLLKSKMRRETDMLARYGGEEFCVLLPNTSPEGAHYVAEQLRETIASVPVLIPGQRTLNLTISIGVSALVPDTIEDREKLLAAADAAVYDAKNAGRNRTMVRSLG